MEVANGLTAEDTVVIRRTSSANNALPATEANNALPATEANNAVPATEANNAVPATEANNALPATEANKMEFLNLFVKHRLVEEIRPQFDAFRSGLGVSFGGGIFEELRQCCTPNDIQLLLCGVVDIDVEDWKQSGKY
jgi:hypothetical protein